MRKVKQRETKKREREKETEYQNIKMKYSASNFLE